MGLSSSVDSRGLVVDTAEALHSAIVENNPVHVAKILKHNPLLANTPNTQGKVPLFVALTIPNSDAIVEVLLTHGADATSPNLLHEAVKTVQNKSVIKRLVESGANVLGLDDQGNTPIRCLRNKRRSIFFSDEYIELIHTLDVYLSEEMQKVKAKSIVHLFAAGDNDEDDHHYADHSMAGAIEEIELPSCSCVIS